MKQKIKHIEEETTKFPFTNVYARIFSLSSDEGRRKAGDFTRDYSHLFTAYETKNLDSQEELSETEAISSAMEHVNVMDLIIEHGVKILRSQGKAPEQIEQYIMRLKRVCLLN